MYQSIDGLHLSIDGLILVIDGLLYAIDALNMHIYGLISSIDKLYRLIDALYCYLDGLILIHGKTCFMHIYRKISLPLTISTWFNTLPKGNLIFLDSSFRDGAKHQGKSI